MDPASWVKIPVSRTKASTRLGVTQGAGLTLPRVADAQARGCIAITEVHP